MKKIIGQVIAGSLSEGFTVRVHQGVLADDIKTGKFVSIVSGSTVFFSLITDLSLQVSHPDILLFPPTSQETILQKQLLSRDMYISIQLRPMLMVCGNNRQPVKTIPAHFSSVYEADKKDVMRVFGDEDDSNGAYFRVGTPLDMSTPICIDLAKLTERSNGVFGKTGTGKTFLTRVLLAGLIKQRQAAVLIFDMHSEYGLQARCEGKGLSFVKGLKTLFPDRVAIFSLDPVSTRRRGGNPDVEVVIPYNAVFPEDILSLQYELNLHATAVEATYLIAARYKSDWLRALLSATDIKEFAESVGAHPESVAALYRKLKRVEKLSFLQPLSVHEGIHSCIEQMLAYIHKGISVVIEFGNYTDSFVYLLVANIITRRIHADYIARTEQFLGSQRAEDEPQKLLICIEEAHKFLNPQAAKQTIFGTIAREMRKYYVSLLVVDQRPSGIDPEILSQLGTKISAQLNDEKDIQAVLTGMNASTGLKAILASLDSKKQALLFGHAMAMPIVIQPREYDQIFYQEMSEVVTSQQIDSFVKELF